MSVCCTLPAAVQQYLAWEGGLQLPLYHTPSSCTCCALQAKEALKHPYFDDLDKETVDALENEALRYD